MPNARIRVSFKQAIGLLGPYARARVLEQIKSVFVIIVYLVLFQTIVLGIPIARAGLIALGLSLVIGGLTFFMEGLLLGLMPLGEVIGVKLPQKSKLPVILIFAFILGVGATFAEPAIGVLKAAGSSVKAWDAPLLFLLLNKHAAYLVYAVGAGVGIAVLFGTLRFLYNWSLKPFVFILTGLLLVFSVWATFDKNMVYLVGLAWDCGGVTTGPVTVPLVLALGIGICRIVGSADSGSAGFGVVTLASLFPIIMVLMLGLPFLSQVPQPMSDVEFFSPQTRSQAEGLFDSPEKFRGYAFKNASEAAQTRLFETNEAMLEFLKAVAADPAKDAAVFGTGPEAVRNWALHYGTPQQQAAVFGGESQIKEAAGALRNSPAEVLDVTDLIQRNGIVAAQAIIPLSLFLILVLLVILREKLPRADEIILGVVFAVIGMLLFNIGIELGLARLGSQVGGKLPSSFKAIELPDQRTTIPGFERSLVQKAITEAGSQVEFFYARVEGEFVALPFEEANHEELTGSYSYTPKIGPLFGHEGGLAGIIVVLVFAFLMGYGATLAEPALNALGLTVEELTVGTFKKSLLMQTVALGVGTGIMFGVSKIVWDVPLIYLLVPPYLVVGLATWLSTEEFVNIGWDSAGVTTGPITVPLVLAMGLGISGQVGVVEGFGILALASVWPILFVLLVGLLVTRKRKAAMKVQPTEMPS